MNCSINKRRHQEREDQDKPGQGRRQIYSSIRRATEGGHPSPSNLLKPGEITCSGLMRPDVLAETPEDKRDAVLSSYHRNRQAPGQ